MSEPFVANDLSSVELGAIVAEALKTCEAGVWVDRGSSEHLWTHEDKERAVLALEELVRRAIIEGRA